MSLEIREIFSETEDMWEIELEGELDINTSNILKERLLKLIEEKNKSILLKSENLSYIDSTGLGILISVLKKVRLEDNKIIFYKPKSNIIKLLKITGLSKIFEIIEEGVN